MAKFCTECGKEIADGVSFCTECGTKAPADPPTATTETVTEAKETKVEIPVVHTPTAQSYQAQQTYTQPAPDPTSKVVGTGAYFGLMLLFAIPIIGQIACLIMAFAPKNKNIKNFARAMLIWTVIALVIGGLIIGGIYMVTSKLMDYVNDLTNGQFKDIGELFGQLGSLGGLAGQLGGVDINSFIEQFQSGDVGGLLDQYQNGELDGILQQYQNGELEGVLDQYQSGELEELLDQFQSGDVGDLVSQYGN